MTYAVIHDVPASWERYEVLGRIVSRSVPGLLLHVAGPTDEGVRIVELWVSEAAWRAFAPTLEAGLRSLDPDLPPHAVVRDLRARHVVLGKGWDTAAATDTDLTGAMERPR
jgi:hypothetical protein